MNATSSALSSPDRNHSITLYEMILPPRAILLCGLLLLILPLTILAGEGLLLPIFERIQTFVMGSSQYGSGMLPGHFFLKLGAFGLLTFLGVVQLVMRINTTYYSTWAQTFSRPHELHVDYHPDEQQSMLALLNWNIYRIFSVVFPPLALGTVTVAVGMVELSIFNHLIELPFISLPVQFIVAMFVTLLLIMFTVFAVINSLWIGFTTLFGDVIAMMEPDLPSKVVFDRCSRIAFSSPTVFLLYSCYFIFILWVFAMFYLFVTHYDILDLIHFRIDFITVIFLEVLTLGLYIMLNYLKLYTYHRALFAYYHKLPDYFKSRFQPPPPIHQTKATACDDSDD